jgi:hypothetical protein
MLKSFTDEVVQVKQHSFVLDRGKQPALVVTAAGRPYCGIEERVQLFR